MSNETINQRASYLCVCKFGYYVPNQTLQGFEGLDIESNVGNYSCIPCPDNCLNCDEKGECSTSESLDNIPMEALLRFTIAIILGSCMFCCLILAIIVFRQRKCKVGYIKRNCEMASPIRQQTFQTMRFNSIHFHFRRYQAACGRFWK